MNTLRDQLDLLKEFCSADYRRILVFCALGMLGAAVLGAGVSLFAPQRAAETLNSFVVQIQESGVMDEEGNISVFALLMNNWRAMLFSAAYGFIPFLYLPLVSLLANGALMGMLGGMYLAAGALPVFLAGILPHGVFEIPALALSVACGVCLCRNMCRVVTGSPKREPMVELLGDLLRVLLLLVMPLTVAAAFVECYVTPVVIGLFL